MNFVPFSPELAPSFDTINRQWISRMFTIEPIDERVISNPQTYIINRGGYIWFAVDHNKKAVGTCALMKKQDGVFELTKMGVLEEAQGQKIGENLLKHVLQFAPTIAFNSLFLLTNAKCEAAIHLYEKLGFEHDKNILKKYGAAYSRCNVAMQYRKPAR